MFDEYIGIELPVLEFFEFVKEKVIKKIESGKSNHDKLWVERLNNISGEEFANSVHENQIFRYFYDFSHNYQHGSTWGVSSIRDAMHRTVDDLITIIENFGLGIKEVEDRSNWSLVWQKLDNNYQYKCSCGHDFEVKTNYKRLCPECYNDDFKYLHQSGTPVQLSYDCFTYHDDNKLKVKIHSFQAGINKHSRKLYIQRYSFYNIVCNLETGRNYFLWKKTEGTNYKIQAVKPRCLLGLAIKDRALAEFAQIFMEEKDMEIEYLKGIESLLIEKDESYDKIVFETDTTKKNIIRPVEYFKNTVLFASLLVLNRNPELLPLFEYTAKISEPLFESVVYGVLHNYPHNLKGLSPDKLLTKIYGVPINKSIAKDLTRKKLSPRDIKQYSWLVGKFGIDNARTIYHSKAKRRIFDILTSQLLEKQHYRGYDEDFRIITDMLDKYDSTFVKNKILKLFESQKWQYCIDILNMSRQLASYSYEFAEKVQTEYDFGSMSEDEIEKVHNSLIVLDSQIQNKDIEELFSNRIEKLKDFEYESDEYRIILPESPVDLTIEGNEMGHCVGSYARGMAKGSCTIFFLRDDNNERVATVEVRNNSVVQCKGPRNFKPNDSVFDFLKEWCSEKKLSYRYW